MNRVPDIGPAPTPGQPCYLACGGTIDPDEPDFGLCTDCLNLCDPAAEWGHSTLAILRSMGGPREVQS